MEHNLSFWELDTYFDAIDVVIIGSGIIGLNAALNLKLASPELKILVLERGFLPTGASTKNAGFTCFGSPSELLDDIKNADEATVLALVEKRWRGLQKLRQNLGDKTMEFYQWGGYEVFDDDAVYEACMDRLEYLNRHIGAITGIKNVYINADDKIQDLGLSQVKHLILNVAEGQIHTGHMMAALTKRVQELGVMIINSIQVNGFDNEGDSVCVHTNQHFSFKARKLLIAVNGFARELLPDYPVIAARSQVLVTSPVADLKLRGTFHYDEGYYYFRNIGDRVLLGGGRNLDFAGEQTSAFGLTELIQSRLEEMLRTMILPGKTYAIETRWSGIMGLGNRDKTFIVKKVRENIFCSVRMGGMGVAVGSLVGEEAARMVLEDGCYGPLMALRKAVS